MFGSTEILLILIAALFLFGPDKMPEMARSLGKMMGDFKRAMREAEAEVSISEVKESKKENTNIEENKI